MHHKLCIVGAGYVGLPLAVAFSKHYPTMLYSHSQSHINALKKGDDRTESFSAEELKNARIHFTSDKNDISEANTYIVSVPTPVDEANNPDLSSVIDATKNIATFLKNGDLVIYESTVFIGCTEEICVPFLTQGSGLKYNSEFFCGFSPERINPADRERTISDVVKIVAGSTPEISLIMEKLYGTIVKAGIHIAPSMKVAEASKLTENIQRDVNIALMNELSHIFNSLEIDTHDVIEAASTKWNFNTYYPGLVGGHCISVDPYYLIYNAEKSSTPATLIKSAREINSQMPTYIVKESLRLMEAKGVDPQTSSVLLLGISFKEDCPDIRNSQSAEIALSLSKRVASVDVFDPVVDTDEVFKTYRIRCIESIQKGSLYDAVVITVAHSQFKKIDIKKLLKKDGVLFDAKGILSIAESDARL